MLVYLLFVFVANLCTRLTSCQEVCRTEDCVKVSQWIMNNLNTSVDPCVDMYEFACGGWMQNNSIPEGYKKWSVFRKMGDSTVVKQIEVLEADGWVFRGRHSSAVKKVKQFYKSCKDIQAIERKGAEPLIKLIDEHGSWTVTNTNKSWNRNTWTIQEALQNSHKLMGRSLWAINIYKDLKNASRNMMNFYQAAVTLEGEEYNYNRTSVRNEFMELAMKVGRLLGGQNDTVYDKMSEVFNFEISLSEIFLPSEALQDPEEIYNKMTLHEFQQLIGNWIDLNKYMEAIFGKGVVHCNDEISTYMPEYFGRLETLVQATDKEVLANYIMWNLIQPTFDYLPVDNTREHENRQKLCVDESRNALPLVSGALYVDRYLSEETRVKVVSLINYIKNEFVNSLNQTTWVDEETKTRLEEKVEAMPSIVGYQDWILDPCQLDAKYEDLVVEEGEYFKNFIHFKKYDINNERKKLKQEPTTKTFKFVPDRADAPYEYHLNMMVVNAGLLQEPIISKNYPTSYLYGMLGSVLARNIIYAFDKTGRKHDKYGNLNETWTPRLVEEFARRSKCFIDQYSIFELYGQNISGVLTLAENIADNGGLNLAFKAYRSSVGSDEARLPGVNLTDDQLFFVGMSQFYCALETRESAIRNMHNSEYAHNHFRVLGSNSNSREFSKAFNCPLNSPMNPEKKCVIW